jgi:predicted phosphohydrolase
MRILHLSDTHKQHRLLGNMPAADVVVHSGDVTFAGTAVEVLDFIRWFSSLDYPYKIFIGGNHDYVLEGAAPDRVQRLLPKNCFYLYNSGVSIEGIRFWGIPFFFSPEAPTPNDQTVNQIPDECDVLITHRPPLGILDRSVKFNMGCPDLLGIVKRVRPTIHLFGHIHDAYGTKIHKGTTFSNGSVVNSMYRLVNDPVLFEL